MVVLYNIVCINRDTMTQVMSLPIKTVMEYKAHNISLKYEYPNTRHVFNSVCGSKTVMSILSTEIGLATEIQMCLCNDNTILMAHTWSYMNSSHMHTHSGTNTTILYMYMYMYVHIHVYVHHIHVYMMMKCVVSSFT